MSGYRLRPRAETDLAEIFRFTVERWGIDQAERYHKGLVAAFHRLALNPTLGRACEEIKPNYRRLNVGAHVFFYRLTKGQPDIIRVLHARRDFHRHLPRSVKP